MKCPVSGKTCFAHKRDAAEFINRRHEALRPYHCPDCNKWHVTKRVEPRELVPKEFLNKPIQHEQDFKRYLL